MCMLCIEVEYPVKCGAVRLGAGGNYWHHRSGRIGREERRKKVGRVGLACLRACAGQEQEQGMSTRGGEEGRGEERRRGLFGFYDTDRHKTSAAAAAAGRPANRCLYTTHRSPLTSLDCSLTTKLSVSTGSWHETNRITIPYLPACRCGRRHVLLAGVCLFVCLFDRSVQLGQEEEEEEEEEEAEGGRTGRTGRA